MQRPTAQRLVPALGGHVAEQALHGSKAVAVRVQADGVKGRLGAQATVQRRRVGQGLVVEDKGTSTSVLERRVHTEVRRADNGIAHLTK